MSTKQRVEAVATGHEPLSEEGGEHDPQLVTTDTGILATYLTYGIQHETFILHMAPNVSLGLVIGFDDNGQTDGRLALLSSCEA